MECSDGEVPDEANEGENEDGGECAQERREESGQAVISARRGRYAAGWRAISEGDNHRGGQECA